MSESPGEDAQAAAARQFLSLLFMAYVNYMREQEDADDIADAEVAWAEGGEPVSFEELEAEFA